MSSLSVPTAKPLAVSSLDALPGPSLKTSVAEITGYGASEVIGNNCQFLLEDDQDPAALAIFSKRLNKSDNMGKRFINYRKDRSLFYNKLNVYPVSDESKEIKPYVGVEKRCDFFNRDR